MTFTVEEAKQHVVKDFVRTRCPICGRNLDGDLPDSAFPELCSACAKKERTIRAKKIDGRSLDQNQQSLF